MLFVGSFVCLFFISVCLNPFDGSRVETTHLFCSVFAIPSIRHSLKIEEGPLSAYLQKFGDFLQLRDVVFIVAAVVLQQREDVVKFSVILPAETRRLPAAAGCCFRCSRSCLAAAGRRG